MDTFAIGYLIFSGLVLITLTFFHVKLIKYNRELKIEREKAEILRILKGGHRMGYTDSSGPR